MTMTCIFYDTDTAGIFLKNAIQIKCKMIKNENDYSYLYC